MSLEWEKQALGLWTARVTRQLRVTVWRYWRGRSTCRYTWRMQIKDRHYAVAFLAEDDEHRGTYRTGKAARAACEACVAALRAALAEGSE